jgi:hypothetical protein
MVLMRKSKHEREREREREGEKKLDEFSVFREISGERREPKSFRRTQATVAEEKLEMSMIESLGPIAPSSGFLVNENPQREGDAEKNCEKRRR